MNTLDESSRSTRKSGSGDETRVTPVEARTPPQSNPRDGTPINVKKTGDILLTGAMGKQERVGLGWVLFAAYPDFYGYRHGLHTQMDHINGKSTENDAWGGGDHIRSDRLTALFLRFFKIAISHTTENVEDNRDNGDRDRGAPRTRRNALENVPVEDRDCVQRQWKNRLCYDENCRSE